MPTDAEQAAVPLFCPSCSYNVTGLPESRCPECGQVFDLERARPLEVSTFNPVGLAGVLGRLIWPPAVFMLSVAAGVQVRDLNVAMFILGGLVWLVFGVINSNRLGWRLAANRAARTGRSVPIRADRRFVHTIAVGLFLCQLFIGFCGCAVVVITS